MDRLALSLLLALAVGACGPSTTSTDSETGSETGDETDASMSEGSATGETSESSGENTTSSSDPTATSDSPTTSTTQTGPAGIDVSGQYLMAISTVADPEHPLFSLVTVDGSFGPDGGMMDITSQSLAVEPLETTPLPELVGTPTTINDVAISALGEFNLEYPGLLIPTEANPSAAFELVFDLALAGAFQHPVDEAMCGLVDGALVQPIMGDISGSSFAAVKVAGLDALPPTSPSMCP